jgi:hypothetical protein
VKKIFKNLPEGMRLTHMLTIMEACKTGWFNKSNTQFFRTTYPMMGLETQEAYYFTTRDKCGSNRTPYSVRVLCKESGQVTTFQGQFQAFADRKSAQNYLYSQVVAQL